MWRGQGYHGSHAAVMLVVLLAVLMIQGSAASTRALLQDVTCSSSKACPDNANCCSQWGYCGSTSDYCGVGCINGPCYSNPPPTTPPPPGPPGSSWKSFFTKAVFEAWFPNRKKNFYTFEEFSKAASAYPTFGNNGSTAANKREIAAFFGNVQQESGGLYYVEEINGPTDPNKVYCDASNKQYPCAPGKKYFGRGPIQLSWNYNYGACGKDLGLSLLADPDQVARSGATAFKTALWFWVRRGCHDQIIKNPPSFAGTIRIINGGQECGHGYDERVENRVKYYTKFCKALNVDPGTDLRC
ncbi:hypothetical protein M758_3G027300 [Ceratodon purpureus]|uniref:Chitin-binding type-1 domain-containing protein n=1 Tax=Ceratodon purpureus TaxID=3225 RepID=A0A8T0IE80_CERPU|nr:hypothetical protein KC19_3G027900 [Ceratodon purpureus]KAG0621534.1 hypothetical protein M758_3G027300 [Ceratodon purpureus]